MAQIAEAADTAHGSFYNHFSSKDDILAAVFEDTLTLQFSLLEERNRGVEDPAERVSVAHRHLLAAVRADPDWGWLILRLDVPYGIVEDVLGADATNDLQAGIRTGRFAVASPAVALHAAGGALIGLVHLILRDGLGDEADVAHAEGVLRSFGVEPREAAAIARRPLPEPAA